MADLTDVTAAASAYAQAQVDAAVAAQKATDQVLIDEATAAQASADQRAADASAATDVARAALAALQAKYDEYVRTHTKPDVEMIEFSDFASRYAGLDLFNSGKSLTGRGSDVTTYQVKPMTSTRKAFVEAKVKGDTNPCYVVRAAGIDSAHTAADLEFSGFAIQGTEQGHLYGGIQIGWSNRTKVHDITIRDIPGNASGPPGETFLLNLWHANDSTVRDILLDGGKVGATLLGLNTVDGCTVRDVTLRNAVYGFGAALWQTSNVLFENVTFDTNRKALNIEDARGGTHMFRNCTFKNTSVSNIAQVSAAYASDDLRASTKVTFEDPIVDSWPIRVQVFPNSTTNRQLASDIHVVINGIDVSNDKSKLVTF